MIQMERTSYGLHIVISGTTSVDEVSAWLQALSLVLTPISYNLLVYVDVTDCSPLITEVKDLLQEGFERFLDLNLVRVSVIYSTFISRLQFENILIKAGVEIYHFFNERTPAFRRTSREWLVSGVLDE